MYLNLGSEIEQGRVGEAGLVEGMQVNVAIQERRGRAVRQAVVGGLARSRRPRFRILADDVVTGLERVDVDGLHLVHVALKLRAQAKSGVDGALRMVLGGPKLDVGLVNHEAVAVAEVAA